MSDARAERLARWRSELDGLPERVAEVLESPLEIHGSALVVPDTVVTTGLGSSEAQARLLAHLLADLGGLPARYVPTGRLQSTPLAARRRTTLVVVTQGLTPNARLALADAAAWDRVVLVTAVVPGAAGFDPDRVRFVDDLIRAGVTCVAIPVPPDHGALLRVEGPVVGLAVVWRLARAWLAPPSHHALSLSGDRVRQAMVDAPRRARLAFPPLEPLVPFFARDPDDSAHAHAYAHAPVLDPDSAPAPAPASGEVHLTASGGYDDLASDLELELYEGFRLTHVWRSDATAFTHGPFQSLAERRVSILHLGHEGDALDEEARARLERTISSELHRLKVLEASLPGAAALFEHERMLGELLLRWHEETGLDPTRWPGLDRDEPLYGWGDHVAPPSSAGATRDGPARIDVMTSPEIAGALEVGRRTIVVPLGSTEQHGPHLPLGTDTWIADELARRLVTRRSDAWALPALPFGCAEEHMAFPGTSSLAASTLQTVIVDLLRSAAEHGFERAFVFSAHGGNVDALCAMSDQLASLDARLRVRVCAEPGAVSSAQAAAASKYGVSPEEAGHHAGEWETSVIAALAPGRVRSDRLEAGHLVSPEDGGSLFYPSLAERVPGGVIGDPRGADPRRADAYLDAWVDVLETDLASAFGEAGGGTARSSRPSRLSRQ